MRERSDVYTCWRYRCPYMMTFRREDDAVVWAFVCHMPRDGRCCTTSTRFFAG